MRSIVPIVRRGKRGGAAILLLVIVTALYIGEPCERVFGISIVGCLLMEQSVPIYQQYMSSEYSMVSGKQQLLLEEVGSDTAVLAWKENEDKRLKEEVPETNPKIGEVYREVKQQNVVESSASLVTQLKQKNSAAYMLKNFFIVDGTTSVPSHFFDVKGLLEEDFTIKKDNKKVQVLIYHTHGASEQFADSRKNHDEDGVIGMGDELTKVLQEMGYGVLHDKTKYDLIQGKIDRSLGYNKALDGVQNILKEHKDIEVIIDLHRDGVQKRIHNTVEIEGRKTAKVMFFNGMSRSKSGEIPYLKNENRMSNIAFSLQLKCAGMNQYNEFVKPVYLKGYRYNLHLKKRSLLIELGNNLNTVEEAKNAIRPLAEILNKVLMVKNKNNE